MWSDLLVLLGGFGLVFAQSAAKASNVPAGVAISGNYGGQLRPQLHFSAPQGFINDPNGLFVDGDGVYHLYYQYNPTQTVAGNQHWGHATSRDLYQWTNQAIAIAPSNSSEGIFSGSAVVDVNNTSGFFPNQTNGVVAFYTLNSPNEQTQNIAYSYDNGYSFIKYAGNPVISIGSKQFRDPKVIWYQDHWVMLVSFVTEFSVGIYTSPNMLNWTLASNFSHHGLLGLQWECPNLVQMPMENSTTPMWLMYVSINPGAPQGGSIAQYYPGAFNGTHFTAVDSAFRMADFGKDNYAAQFFYGIPGNQKQISMAWASNWQYTNYVPTGPAEGWQSVMSLPRVNYLKNSTRVGYTMVSQPYNLAGYRGSSPVVSNQSLGNGTLYANMVGGTGSFVLEVNMTNINATALSNTATVNYTIMSSVSGESVRGGMFFNSENYAYIWLDRGNTISSFPSNPFATDKISTAQALPTTNSFDFQVYIDRSIVELFTLGGEQSATMVYYPEYLLDTVVLKTGALNQGVSIQAAVYELRSAWATQANATGYVQSNGTMAVKRDLVYERRWTA